MFTWTERVALLAGLELLIAQESHDIRWALAAPRSVSRAGIQSRTRALATAGRLAIEITETLV